MLRVALTCSALAAAAQGLVTRTMPVSGLKCDGNQTAWVLYPDDGSKYPLVAFAHGHSAWDVPTWFPYLLENIAEKGYVVVAAEAGTASCSDQHYDQIRSLQWALQSPDLLAHIDASPGTGILGHSMGGGSTITSASNATAIATYNIKVAVAMHPSSGRPNEPKIPILYLTGTTDTTVKPSGVLKQYNAATNVDKTLANVVNASHVDSTGCPVGCGTFSVPPWGENHEGAYAWDSLDCYLKGSAEACTRVHTCTELHAVTGASLEVADCRHDAGKVGILV